MSQGAKAATFGNVLEKTVEGTLLGHGYILVGDNSLKKQRLGILSSCIASSKRYARQVYIGQGIYGTDIYKDFL